MVDVAYLVASYWRHHALAAGDRQQRLEAEDWFWAWQAVEDAMEGPDPLGLLEALLGDECADPCFLGAGPLEDLLVSDPTRWGPLVEERCRRDARWRGAVACVWLDETVRRALPMLQPYLTPAD